MWRCLLFSPDGTIVYFRRGRSGHRERRDSQPARDDVFAVDENNKQRHIWKIAVATGAETQVTSGDASVAEYKLSSDGPGASRFSARPHRSWPTPPGAKCG